LLFCRVDRSNPLSDISPRGERKKADGKTIGFSWPGLKVFSAA